MKKVLALVMIANMACNSPEKTEPSIFINDLTAVDVYQNFESKGFKVDKQFDATNGNLWTCKMQEGDINYTVEVFSHDDSKVETVSATVVCGANNELNQTKEFFGYAATLQYEGAEPNKARQWVFDNFNKDKDSIIIGDACFKILAPSKYVRILNVSKK